MARVGGHMLESASTVQSIKALSVGEAEYYAVVKGGGVALMLRSLYTHAGVDIECQVESDSSTAGSLSERNGPGLRTKHLHTKFL